MMPGAALVSGASDGLCRALAIEDEVRRSEWTVLRNHAHVLVLDPPW